MSEWKASGKALLDGDAHALRQMDTQLAAAYALGKSHGPDWLPIADAPRDGTPVWLYAEGQQTEAFYCPLEVHLNWEGQDASTGAVWSCADNEWEIEVEEYINPDGSLSYNDGPATHYMPLPILPEPKS